MQLHPFRHQSTTTSFPQVLKPSRLTIHTYHYYHFSYSPLIITQSLTFRSPQSGHTFPNGFRSDVVARGATQSAAKGGMCYFVGYIVEVAFFICFTNTSWQHVCRALPQRRYTNRLSCSRPNRCRSRRYLLRKKLSCLEILLLNISFIQIYQ